MLKEFIAGASGGLWRLEIYKFKKDGSFSGKIELFTDISTNPFASQKDRITVDEEGNIYQLLPKKDGVHIIKWESK